MSGWFRPPPPAGAAAGRRARAAAGRRAWAAGPGVAPVVRLRPVGPSSPADPFDPLEERLRHDLPALADALASGALAEVADDAHEPAARPLVPRGALIALGAPVDSDRRWRRPAAAAAAGLVALSGLGLLLRTTAGSSRIATDPSEAAGVPVPDADATGSTTVALTIVGTGQAVPATTELAPVPVVSATIVASTPDAVVPAAGGTGPGGAGVGPGGGPGGGGGATPTAPATTRPPADTAGPPTTVAPTTTRPTTPVTGPSSTDHLPLGLANPGSQRLVVGVPCLVGLKASGGDGSTRVWTATGLPLGLAINKATGVITGRPLKIGVYSVRVTVADATASTNQGFTVVVL